MIRSIVPLKKTRICAEKYMRIFLDCLLMRWIQRWLEVYCICTLKVWWTKSPDRRFHNVNDFLCVCFSFQVCLQDEWSACLQFVCHRAIIYNLYSDGLALGQNCQRWVETCMQHCFYLPCSKCSICWCWISIWKHDNLQLRNKAKYSIYLSRIMAY